MVVGSSFLSLYVKRNGGMLHFRMKVPERLRKVFGVSEIIRSLRTNNQREAGRRAQRLALVIGRLFDDIEKGTYKGMDDKEIRRLVTQWMNEALEDDERRRLTRPCPRTIDDVENESEALSLFQAEDLERLATDDYGKYARLAEEILHDNGITLQKDDVSFRKFCRELIKASISLHEEIKRRNDGAYQEEYDIRTLEAPRSTVEAVKLALTEQGITSNTLQASVLQARADGTNSKNDAILRKSDLLSSVVDAWVKDKLQLGEWTEHTRRDNEPMIREFVEMVEDKPIGLLAAEHLRDARERFLRIPKNRKQTRKYDGMTLRELSEMEIPEAARLSKQTLHNRAVKIGGFLKWARDRGYPVADGLEKVMAFKKERRKASEYKSVFTPDDLTKIFNPELYLKEAKGQSARFWVPLIGLCTGMRIEEICQLELDDIHTVPSRVYPELPGVLCFDVNEEGEKHVKSGASERKVPMSPVLEELGFLEYVEKLRRDKQTRLFPELGKNESGGKYSATVSKWFGRYLDKVGIQDDPKLGKKTFHSFRHTFVTLCYDFRVSGRDIKHVVGHAEKFDITSDQYGKVGDVAVLYKEVMVKAVPIVDLKPLKDALKDNPIW